MLELTKINLGCGVHKKEGYINVDWNPDNKPEVAHDLNVFPYPFATSSVDRVEASHVIEHLDKPFNVMKELHRILKPGGIAVIQVPHFSRGFTHAEHAHGFDITFPAYFNPALDGVSGYYGVEFTIQKMELHWLAFFHLLPLMGYGKFTITVLKCINKVVSFLANLSPSFCSRIWCYWVGGFDEIYFEFVCKKESNV